MTEPEGQKTIGCDYSGTVSKGTLFFVGRIVAQVPAGNIDVLCRSVVQLDPAAVVVGRVHADVNVCRHDLINDQSRFI